MPKKKKKGKKGKKKKEYLPPIYDIPAYDNPYETTPKVKLRLILANPPVDALNQDIELPINTRLDYLVNKIKEKHSGAIGDVIIYKDQHEKVETLDLTKKIEDCGLSINPGSEVALPVYYDFKPVTYPILF